MGYSFVRLQSVTQVTGTPSPPIPYTMLHSVVSACPHLFG